MADDGNDAPGGARGVERSVARSAHVDLGSEAEADGPPLLVEVEDDPGGNALGADPAQRSPGVLFG